MTVTEDRIDSRAVAHPLEPTSPPRPIRAAVFGLGRAGLHHAALLSTLSGVELAAIGDTHGDARRNARGMGFTPRPFASVETLLRRGGAGLVFVATPYAQRLAVATAALDAGAGIMLEGAPALPADDLRSLVERATAQQRVAAAALPLVYHPVFAAAARILANRALGAVIEVRASRTITRVFHPTQQKAYADPGARGALAHLGAELLLLLTRLFGAPREVQATASALYGPLDDEVRGGWPLAGGGRLGFEVSWSQPGYMRPATVLEIETESGRMLVSEDALELDLVFPRGDFPAGTTKLGRADLPHEARFELDGESRWLEDASFVAWAAGGAEPPTALARMADAACVIDALYASAATGGKPFKVTP